jgi:hypothetical protein
MMPEMSGEVFWELLTLTALPPEEAMAHFLLETPNCGDPRSMRHSLNPLGQLNRALVEFYSGWWDDFAPDCRAAARVEVLCRQMGQTSLSKPPGPHCREEFIGLRRVRTTKGTRALPYWWDSATYQFL